MSKIEFLYFLIPLIKRKIYNPTQRHFIIFCELKMLRKLNSELSKNLVHFLSRISPKENRVSVFRSGPLLDGCDFFRFHKL